MDITITNCRYTPKWVTLQSLIRETTHDKKATITRISRPDGHCGYREPGEYDLAARLGAGDSLNIRLTVT